MNVAAILPIPGVPDELLRVLNDRFRQLSGSASGDTVAKPTSARLLLGQEPTLSKDDAGFLWSVSDYGHLLRWTGTGWEFADEEGGFIAGRVVAPSGPGWQLCDGTATKYLKITAGVVSAVALTTPNLTGIPAYLKMGAAYTGGRNNAANPTTTGVTGTASGGSGAAVASSTHTHTISLAGGDPVANVVMLPYFRK